MNSLFHYPNKVRGTNCKRMLLKLQFLTTIYLWLLLMEILQFLDLLGISPGRNELFSFHQVLVVKFMMSISLRFEALVLS